MSWLKVNRAAEYAGVSVRTLRTWLSHGLRHSRPLGGAIIVNSQSIDEFLKSFEVTADRAAALANEVLDETNPEPKKKGSLK